MLLASCSPGAEDLRGPQPTPPQHLLSETSGALSTTNSAGRSGSFLIPEHNAGQALPVLLGFHATGGDGAGFISAFSELAREQGFAIAAPDSRISPTGEFTWEVGTEPNEVTPDYLHALNCLNELEEEHELNIELSAVLVAGYSGGASSAPYLASSEGQFTAFAILHGGVFPGGLGALRPRGWLSTGEQDNLRSPDHMRGHLESLTNLGFTDLELQIFAGGHGLGSTELTALVQWWLRPDDSTAQR